MRRAIGAKKRTLCVTYRQLETKPNIEDFVLTGLLSHRPVIANAMVE